MNLRNSILVILFFASLSGSLSVFGQLTKKKIAVINVVGMTYKEAKELLQNKGSGVGAVIHNLEVENFDTLFVSKQNPPAKNEKGVQNFFRKGDWVDLWLAGPTTPKDTLKMPIRRVSYQLSSHKPKS